MSPSEHAGGRRTRWRAVLLSILIHASIVAAIGWTWWTRRAPVRAPQQLAIEATVVEQRTASARAAPSPPPCRHRRPSQPPTAASGAAIGGAARRGAGARANMSRKQRPPRPPPRSERNRRQPSATRRRPRSGPRRSRRSAPRSDKAKRESELRAQLAAEERVNAARGSTEEVAWLALIRDRVTRAWIRPPSARAGVNCEVHVTQVPGGVVTGVQIGSCNGDAAVRESIEAAVYRASPLPTPSNPDLFDRNLKFNFHPDE